MKLEILTTAKDADELDYTDEGYGVVKARVTRPGVFPYTGWTVGDPFGDIPIVNLLREESVVNDPQALTTYQHKPVCVGHPWDKVDITNYDEYNVGEMSTDAQFVDGYIEVTLWLKSPRVIAAVLSGVSELSLAFDYLLDPTPGITADGVNYAGRQLDMRVNHIAVVPKGRAGRECCIRMATDGSGLTRYAVRVDNRVATDVDDLSSSSADKETNMTDLKLKPFTFGKDNAIMLPEAEGRDAKTAFDAMVASHTNALAEMKTANDKALAESATALATANDTIKELEAKVATDADIEARVEARGYLMDALKLAGVKMETKGATDHDIRVALLNQRLGADTYAADADVDTVKIAFDAVSKLPQGSAPDAFAGKTAVDTGATDAGTGVHNVENFPNYRIAMDAIGSGTPATPATKGA